MHICSYRPNLAISLFNLALLLYSSPASQYCELKPELVNETRGLEMTRRPAEKRQTRRADIPIPSARSMICSFWSGVSLVVAPIQAGSRAGAVGCACWSRTAWTLPFRPWCFWQFEWIVTCREKWCKKQTWISRVISDVLTTQPRLRSPGLWHCTGCKVWIRKTN